MTNLEEQRYDLFLAKTTLLRRGHDENSAFENCMHVQSSYLSLNLHYWCISSAVIMITIDNTRCSSGSSLPLEMYFVLRINYIIIAREHIVFRPLSESQLDSLTDYIFPLEES